MSNPAVKNPWYEVDLGNSTEFNTITLFEPELVIEDYRLEVYDSGSWKPLSTNSTQSQGRLKIHRFKPLWGEKVRILIDRFSSPPAIAEFGIYNERR